ncbi:MAG: Na/Pi cotransporter family protein, partial [Planctomycetales bacterium]|nr:Na/Pi cotransporter family protein [Planctomycetales bacterium]
MPDPNLPVSLEWGALLSGLGGGLALFLLGMRQLSESLGTVAGESMKNLLARLTANRFTAALAGTVVTAVVQSSSVTTVLLVGFISAGLLNLGSSIGMIIGANIGTTVTVQIIAFNIYKYGLLLIAGGFLLNIASRRQRLQELGLAVLGIGLIFFGMELMSQATGPLRQSPLFLNYLQNVRNPLLGILLGILFTAIVQSSSATTGIVIVLASQGLLSLESGIGLIFGANIGTCVTVVIAALGRPREAVQAAWIHVIFNAGGVLLWMFFIPEFAEGVRRISPTAAQADEVARLTLETPRQIANAHTLFNVGNGLLFIWFTGPLARLVDWLVPQRREKLGIQPLYLDDLYLEQPALALDNVRRELVRLAELNQGMLARALRIVIVGNRDEIAAL